MSVTLDIEDIHVDLRGTPVLKGFNLQLAPGEVRALVGLNGAGKTTALRVALGMLRPDTGRVMLRGQDIWTAKRNMWRDLGHLVESPSTYPELTARENITATAALHEAEPRRAARRAQDLAERLEMTDSLDTPSIDCRSARGRKSASSVPCPTSQQRSFLTSRPTASIRSR